MYPTEGSSFFIWIYKYGPARRARYQDGPLFQAYEYFSKLLLINGGQFWRSFSFFFKSTPAITSRSLSWNPCLLYSQWGVFFKVTLWIWAEYFSNCLKCRVMLISFLLVAYAEIKVADPWLDEADIYIGSAPFVDCPLIGLDTCTWSANTQCENVDGKWFVPLSLGAVSKRSWRPGCLLEILQSLIRFR